MKTLKTSILFLTLCTLLLNTGCDDPQPAPFIFGTDAILLSKKATITITNSNDVPSPFFPGEFTVKAYNSITVPKSGSGRNLVPAHIEAVLPENPPLRAFYDANNNHIIDAYSRSALLYPRSFNNQGTLQNGGAYLGSRQNIVVIAQFSSFTSVERPQYIALFIETNARAGQSIGQNNILSANLVAGDLLNNAPLPGGASMQGIILSSTNPIQLQITSGALPGAINFGTIKGVAEGDVFFTSPGGIIFGSHIKFDFESSLTNDINSDMSNRTGNPTNTSVTLPGP